MSNEFKLPNTKAVIFWPIGTGDSTSIVVKPNQIVMQIDLRDLEKANDSDEPEWCIIDELVKVLPRKGNGRPYLALFVLTHPDKDHVQGFAELLKRVDIGELWHTPKIFRDQSNQEALCEDAKAFRNEVDRRRKAILAAPNAIQPGNRLRVIGHDDILFEDKYKDLPESCKSRPGEIIHFIDGNDLTGHFQSFIHAPFKDDLAKDKNETSLSMNIVLCEGDKYGQFFFFGDREYTTIKRIFETTESTKNNQRDNTPYLFWNVMLSAHHCSKAVMYYQDDGDVEECFKKDIMEYFEKYSIENNGYIVSSSASDFSDEPGKNPPHAKARKRYEEIAKLGHFICTHEYPSKQSPFPMVFTVNTNGFSFDDKRSRSQNPTGLAATVTTARGGTQPPSTQVGFGKL
jgi:hypothetical protein